MRLLVINPNTTAAVTAKIKLVAEAHVAAGTELTVLTAPRGVPFIATRAEAAVASAVALEMAVEHAPGHDAVVIAAFGDPGVGGARELLDVPVVGLAEAAMHTAAMLGRRFGIVAFARAFDAWYWECVEFHAMATRCAGIRMMEVAVRDVAQVQEEHADTLLGLCRQSVESDGADVVILAGAPLAGLAARIAGRCPVPLVDGVAAGIRQAELLAGLKPHKATLGSYRRPDPKPTTGLPTALAARIEGR